MPECSVPAETSRDRESEDPLGVAEVDGSVRTRLHGQDRSPVVLGDRLRDHASAAGAERHVADVSGVERSEEEVTVTCFAETAVATERESGRGDRRGIEPLGSDGPMA